MRRSNANATNAQTTPMNVASTEMGMTRQVVVKSPRSWLRSGLLGRSAFLFFFLSSVTIVSYVPRFLISLYSISIS